MTMTRIVYYYRDTRSPDALARSSQPFTTEQEARGEAKLLSGAGYCGAIEKHDEVKEDDATDEGWQIDWEDAGERAVEIVDNL